MSGSGREHKVAILLFARTARHEALEKRFLPSGKACDNFWVADTMLEQTRQTLSQSQCPTIITYDTEQKGGNFNERLTNAIDDVFALGYQKVIAVGSDTPSLTVDHLDHSVREMQEHDLVIGPSKDGGVYLLGITRKAFDKEHFLALPWLTSGLQQHLMDYSDRNGSRFILLEELADVDNASDLLSLLAELPVHTALYHLVMHLIRCGSSAYIHQSPALALRECQSTLRKRGPPARA